jgi:MSHA biogenesis protein MshG
MANFAYTGRSSGAAVSGLLDAATAIAAAQALAARGIVPLTIAAQGKAAPVAAVSPAAGAAPSPWADPLKAMKRWAQSAVGAVDLMLFCRQLQTLLKAGVPILRALACLQESAAHPGMARTLAALRLSLESGIDLSTSMARHSSVFSGLFVALVRVGELTGRLDTVLLRLYHHLEFEMLMAQQVKSALRYPLFVVAAMAAAIGVINVMVIPAFASVFASFGAALPLPTRILIATSNFTVHYGGLIVALFVVAGWFYRRWSQTPAGRVEVDRLTLRLPLAGKIVSKSALARLARSLALSLKSGVPVEQALGVVSQCVGNSHVAAKVEQMRQAVARGESILRAAAASGVFTPMVLQMVAVGEETGAIDELLDEVADLYTNEVQYELKTLGQQIEPILIIFLGAVVLVLALGVFLPVWDLGRVSIRH